MGAARRRVQAARLNHLALDGDPMQKTSHQIGETNMKGPHVCTCLCSLCERLGTGAFGPQPDGALAVVVVRRRGVRRAKHGAGPLPSQASMGGAPC